MNHIDTVLLKEKKIAIIDTGINSEYHDFDKASIEIVDCKIGRQIRKRDINGHGTCCCGEIVKYYENAHIVVLPILDKNRVCSLIDLCYALYYCLNREDIGIVNLSLACLIEDQDILMYLKNLIETLRDYGKILVASYMNDTNYQNVYPYSFHNVIGVKFARNHQNFIRLDKLKNNVLFYGTDCIMPFHDGRYKVFSGNSSYAAKLTGLLAYEINNNNTSSISLEDLLMNCNKRLKFIDEYCNKFIQCSDNNIFDVIKRAICLVDSKKNQIYDTDNINRKLASYDYKNYVELLGYIEKMLGTRLDYKIFTIYDFGDVNTLAAKIEGNYFA